MQGFGRPLPVPKLQPFSKNLASRALQHIEEPSLETAEAARSLLNMLGDVRLRYQQVWPNMYAVHERFPWVHFASDCNELVHFCYT